MSSERRQEWLGEIMPLFLKYGFKSVGVDDIAKELGISKKTLYQEFKDKNEIVVDCVRAFMHQEEITTQEILLSSENAIDEVIQIAKVITQKMDHLHPSVHFDVEKYYPVANKIFEKHKSEFVFNCIKDNVHRGIKEGLYRSNLDADIISGLFVHKMNLFIDRDGFGNKNYSFKEVYLEMIRYHIRGMASEKGRDYLRERIKNETLNF